MLALFILPALLGAAFLVNVFEDDDDDDVSVPDAIKDLDPENVYPTVQTIINDTSLIENLLIDRSDNVTVGTGDDDDISGSQADDFIYGTADDDSISALEGSDIVLGGQGNDTIDLGAGDDFVLPDIGENNLDYSNLSGNDVIRGGDGDDIIGDLLGKNRLVGNQGDDVLVAIDAPNIDPYYYNDAESGTSDTLIGGAGTDLLVGDDGHVMAGGLGSDIFVALDDENQTGADVFAEVRITDFNTEEDYLMLLHVKGAIESDVELTFDDKINAVRASYEDRPVAILEGLTAADISKIQSIAVSWDQA
ncbi:MAG: hypothetical protein GQ539_06770 [Sulfitobacter sp.]|nr:hypothetical protein [Sulfitobacter sp.]